MVRSRRGVHEAEAVRGGRASQGSCRSPRTAHTGDCGRGPSTAGPLPGRERPGSVSSACASPCPLFLQYVPKDLLPVYRDKVVPLADIITPNQFEAE